MSIPKRLVRTVPTNSSVASEIRWDRATRLHPEWQYVTLRDPVDGNLFPITSDYWSKCESDVQKASLISAEELFSRGGVYLDSKYEIHQSFDILLGVPGFVTWTGVEVMYMGFRSGHLALGTYLDRVLRQLDAGTKQKRTGFLVDIFKKREDILLLPLNYWQAA